MENKSSSLTNLHTISGKPLSSSLPNLHTSSSTGCCSACSPTTYATKIQLSHCSSTTRVTVIPTILQKTWNKIKSINKRQQRTVATSSNNYSAPVTPSSLQMKFDFEDEPLSIATTEEHSPNVQDEEEFIDPITENYMKLQKRLSEELHQGQVMFCNFGRCNHGGDGGGGGGGKGVKTTGKYCVTEEFRKKLQQWEMWKVSCGKVTYTDEELKQILPEDFSRKLKEWENIRSGSPCCSSSGVAGGTTTSTSTTVTNAKIEKQIQWLERQLEKVEQEKSKLEMQMRKYLEKEARLEKMREALKNYPREQVLIKTPTAEGFAAAGVDEKFTKKLYEWEKMRGIPAEDGSMALLNPKYYYHQTSANMGTTGSSISSETPEDIQEPCSTVDEPEAEPNTPDMSSSLESINQASGSNTSSADFYGKSRRRSSDAVSTPLSARSPSLSAFTSDDEDSAAGLLKTVKEDADEEEEKDEEEEDEKPELPPNPVVRVNQIVVEDDEDDADVDERRDEKEFEEPKCIPNVFVPTKRTILKPIETDQQSHSSTDLRSPGLIRSMSLTNNYNSPPSWHSSPPSSSTVVTGHNTSTATGSQSPSPGNSPTKLRAEDIWNKNIDASPPPIRDGPKVVGFIPKSPATSLPPVPSSSAQSAGSSGNAYPNFTSCYIQRPVFQHDGLKNFPRMGKAPVWVSPLVARRKMNSANSNGFREEYRQRNNNEFTLDKFLENSNLNLPAVLPGTSSSSSKYTIGGGIPPQDNPVRLVSLSRSSSFGLGKLPSAEPSSPQVLPSSSSSASSSSPPQNESSAAAPRVCKSKSASSILKSSLNLFSKARRSETLNNNNNSNNNDPVPQVKTTRARWFLNKF